MTGIPSVTKGKIVLLPFPFDDLSGTKVRPAVCLTEPIGPHRHVVVAFISSRIPPECLDSDLIVRDDSAAFAATGLRVSSTVRLHRLMTVTVGLFRRELGVVPVAVETEIAERLRRLFF
jgi:mRNA interferase MazF